MGEVRRRKAYQRAEAYFTEIVSRFRNTGGTDRLPTLAAMAAAAGVAKGTMAHAVRVVAKKEMLVVKPGIGVRFGKETPEPTVLAAPALSRLTWETIAAQLRKDILRGVFPAGELLPKTYNLSDAYGVCYRTISKAMRELQAEGLLVRQKKRYVAPEPVKPKGHSSIVLIVAGNKNGPILFQTLRFHDLFRQFENECIQNTITFDLVHFDATAQKLYHGSKGISPAALNRSHALLGIMVWTLGMHTGSSMTNLLVQLASLKLPLAVLEESGNIKSLPAPLDKERLLRFIYLACNERPGYDVGRYLIGLGHTKAAYLAPFHAGDWSLPRLKGLRRAFAEAGYPDAVKEFTSNEYLFTNQYSFTHQGTADQVRALFARTVAPPDTPPEVRYILNSLDKYVASAMDDFVFSRTVLPLFEQASSCPDISAWVAAGDNVAFSALEYLRNSGVAVPQQRTVIGFDNSPRALLQNLTSYDFNARAALHSLFNHLLYPPNTRNRRKGAVIEDVDGFVVPRKTTAAPPD